MAPRYEDYLLADPTFYDASHTAVVEETFDRPMPAGWSRAETGDWVVYRPEGQEPILQGWKIHVSCRLDDAERVLDAVIDECVTHRLPFKFIRSRHLLLLRNSKNADRTASGKFVTIYPNDDTQLERALQELGERLDGVPSPYILSDLRWGEGPLYVRYGGFALRYCSANGELVPAISDDTGTMVPDERGTTFRPPPWVRLPPFLAPHLAVRQAPTVDALPYRIEKALHFSNGGGIYRAVDERTDDTVVLKEARPHAGLTRDGADAVARLRHERSILDRLDGLGVAPILLDAFELDGHEFLVLEHIDGPTLNAAFVRRFPLAHGSLSDGALVEYADWATDVSERIERAVEAVHARGVVIGDLHPPNVLLRDGREVVLVDWEVASSAAEDARPGLGAPGFAAPRALTGVAADRYALACLRLWLFLPLTRMYPLAPRKARQHASEIAATFPLPAGFLDEAVATVLREDTDEARPTDAWDELLTTDPGCWLRARDSMVRAIHASATPARVDRLYPGDVRQFAPGGGVNLAHGAAGVLWALAAVGADAPDEHVEWLLERAGTSEPPVGFYDGLHGVAFALERIGRRDEAMIVLDRCMAADTRGLGLDLTGGLSGIALNLLHFADLTGDSGCLDRAHELAAIIAEKLGGAHDVAITSGGIHPYAGLLRGSSGPALLFLRLYERSGDATLLDLATTAIRQDLRRCVRTDDGALHVNEGWRSMPYLAEGSAGIGVVIGQLLEHRHDDRLASELGAIERGTRPAFYGLSGVFSGRAGLILARTATHPGRPVEEDEAIAGHVRRLDWHALAFEGHLAFPGDGLFRLSMDLATGTAGVLLALGCALEDRALQLPFLTPTRTA